MTKPLTHLGLISPSRCRRRTSDRHAGPGRSGPAALNGWRAAPLTSGWALTAGGVGAETPVPRHRRGPRGRQGLCDVMGDFDGAVDMDPARHTPGMSISWDRPAGTLRREVRFRRIVPLGGTDQTGTGWLRHHRGGIAVTASGDVVVGYSFSGSLTVETVNGPRTVTSAGVTDDALVLKLRGSDGKVLNAWTSGLTATSEAIYGLAIDSADNVYVADTSPGPSQSSMTTCSVVWRSAMGFSP